MDDEKEILRGLVFRMVGVLNMSDVWKDNEETTVVLGACINRILEIKMTLQSVTKFLS